MNGLAAWDLCKPTCKKDTQHTEWVECRASPRGETGERPVAALIIITYRSNDQIASLIDQIALADLLEFQEVVLPIECDTMRILAMSKRIKYSLTGKNFKHLFQMELLGIQLRQSGSQFHPEFRRIKEFPAGQNYIHSVTELSGIVACGRRERYRNKSDSGHLACIQELRELASINPRCTHELKGSVGATPNRDISALN
jgi:hypothetical protein